MELAFSKELPISAHLCLELDLVLSDEILSFFVGVEVLLGLLNSSLLEVFIRGLCLGRGSILRLLVLVTFGFIVSSLGRAVRIVVEGLLAGLLLVVLLGYLKKIRSSFLREIANLSESSSTSAALSH